MNKISIAMATYCGEKYILEQLNSILNQKRKADEVIIFDDCSQDNTANIVSDFIENNDLSETWKFEVNEENLGYIKNFKKALNNVTGDIIFLCDQDDIWHSEKLAITEKIFNDNPEIININSAYLSIDENSKAHKSKKNLKVRKNSITKLTLKSYCSKEIAISNISPGCCIAFKKKVKDVYLKTSSFKLHHDYELNLISALYGEVCFFNRPLVKYRIHGNNAIGLPIEFRIFNFNKSSNDKVAKLEIAINELDYIKSCLIANNKNTNITDAIYMYNENRIDFLLNKNYLSWAKSLFISFSFKKIIYSRFVFEDLFVILTNSKFAKK